MRARRVRSLYPIGRAAGAEFASTRVIGCPFHPPRRSRPARRRHAPRATRHEDEMDSESTHEASPARPIDTGTPEVLCRVEAGVAHVTLHRPEARNALPMDMKLALWELLPALDADADARCILLTGSGDAFCAGGDTKRMKSEGKPPSLEDRRRQLRWEHDLPRWLHEMGTPTVAALPGAAAGAGLGLALACDLRIAADTAVVTTAYARLGLAGDYGVAWFLTHLVGPARARELFFTARRVDAA